MSSTESSTQEEKPSLPEAPPIDKKSLFGSHLLAFFPAYAVAVIAILVCAIYFKKFGVDMELPLSSKQDEWGQFGDYVGGLLNPLCAFMAFVWIVRSYALQKTELADTRAALEKSQQAQLLQAETAYAASRIETINIKLTILSSQADLERAEIEELHRNWKSHGEPVRYQGTTSSVHTVLQKRTIVLQGIERKQNQLLAEIAKIEKTLEAAWSSHRNALRGNLMKD